MPQTENPRDSKTFLPEEVDFTTLVLGLSSAALTYLGETGVGEGTSRHSNLPLARQNIGILELIQKKTVGNLTGEEGEMLTQAIDDLRRKYLRASAQK